MLEYEGSIPHISMRIPVGKCAIAVFQLQFLHQRTYRLHLFSRAERKIKADRISLLSINNQLGKGGFFLCPSSHQIWKRCTLFLRRRQELLSFLGGRRKGFSCCIFHFRLFLRFCFSLHLLRLPDCLRRETLTGKQYRSARYTEYKYDHKNHLPNASSFFSACVGLPELHSLRHGSAASAAGNQIVRILCAAMGAFHSCFLLSRDQSISIDYLGKYDTTRRVLLCFLACLPKRSKIFLQKNRTATQLHSCRARMLTGSSPHAANQYGGKKYEVYVLQ